jgi:DNA-binding response OmpR family regulator
VLIADHEPEVAEMARRYLERAGLRVALADSGAAVSAVASRSADLFVIDLMTPDLEIRALRRALTAPAPVVFLLNRQAARPHGLNSPPDARRWLTRPFSPRALVDAATGLLSTATAEAIRDPAFTRTEYAILAALAAHPGRVLSRQHLLAAVEGERGKTPTPRAIDVYVSQLRAKLGTDAIRTIRGVGYILESRPLSEQRLGIEKALRRQTPGGPSSLPPGWG